MTQAQFKEALLRGQGRCLQVMQADPARYASVVLWACSHEIAFDAQCEGSRAWFVYQLIDCYEDKLPFLQAVIDALGKAKSNGGWLVLYLAELLAHFAYDGNLTAADALWRKYDELYAGLLAKKRRPKQRYFTELDDFHFLCEVLADSPQHMAKIAEDIGLLYRTRSFYKGWDFDWLFVDKAHKHMATLKKHAKRSVNIAAYLAAGQAQEENLRQQKAEQVATPRKRSGVALSIWLWKQADAATVQEYADAYLFQADSEARAEALQAFSCCPYPADPVPILTDALSGCDALRDAAWRALENIRHPDVRAFAVAQLNDSVERALPLFINNYLPQDEPQLYRLVSGLTVDRACTTNWHSIHLDILCMTDTGLKAPLSLLQQIYETTYCSNCREYALRQMGRRHALTDEMLRECLLDSNSDIRAYAKRLLARRQK